MSTHSSANISPLHHQRVRGRQIILTENPRFHLVWYYDRIFIKPLPRYLLSHAFWKLYLLSPSSSLGQSREKVLRAALGLVRSYRYLCRYESDLQIAHTSALIPKDVEWHALCKFLDGFRFVTDAEVSQRYHYGELRLSRLNLWSKVFLRTTFERLEVQLGAYIASYYGPWIVVFAVLSVVLNAMQVILSTAIPGNNPWPVFVQVSKYFGVAALGLVALAIFSVVSVVIFRGVAEVAWTVRNIVRRRKESRLEHCAPDLVQSHTATEKP